ncbi:hypothetical protein X765_13380 [Mesorhizobium sp. LSHC440B00]|nr:hypothetical protein X765_13380 [Mesorhizobium sp. LSHC440B00]
MCALCAIRPAKMIITAKITAHEEVAGDKRLSSRVPLHLASA